MFLFLLVAQVYYQGLIEVCKKKRDDCIRLCGLRVSQAYKIKCAFSCKPNIHDWLVVPLISAALVCC